MADSSGGNDHGGAAGAGEAPVRVYNWPVRVPVSCGGSVTVRRITPSRTVDFQEATGLPATSGAYPFKVSMLSCRWAITGASGLRDVKTGQAVEFDTENHRLLGAIASREVFDVLSEADQMAVINAAMDGQPSEGQAGN